MPPGDSDQSRFSALFFFLTATQFEKQQEVMKRGAAAAESF